MENGERDGQKHGASAEWDRDQFAREVYPSELRDILRRRRVAFHDDEKQIERISDLEAVIQQKRAALEVAEKKGEPPPEPDPKAGLVGLALSGGGIRSATFNLGVLQVFAKHGLLRWWSACSTSASASAVRQEVHQWTGFNPR